MTAIGLGIGALLGGVVSWLLVWAWIGFSLRAHIVDVPNRRSSHVKTTPRGGGVAIVVTVVCGVAVAVERAHNGDVEAVIWAAGLALAIAVMSLIDDVRSIPSIWRLGLQCVAAALAVSTVGAFTVVTLPFAGVVMLPAWLAVALSVVWIVGMTNVYNFMDGIDGIAGGQGVVAGIAWAVFGHLIDGPVVAWAGVLIASSCLGFLIHNWSPARVFMGDVGSAFLGFSFAILPLLALRAHPHAVHWPMEFVGAIPVFATLVVWPFIADGMVTFLRRVRHRQNLLEAHRTHLYQRFTVAGWKHGPVAGLYVVWAVAMSASAALYMWFGGAGRMALLLLACLSLVAVYGLVKREELGFRSAKT